MRTPQPSLGIALVIGAASCFATMDTTVRFVGAYFSVALVLWTRYALHAAIMTLWITASPQRSFRSANPMFQIARGALLAFSSAMAFAALRRMPVAEFTAIVMLTPVVATLLARLWLKERISPLRWTLVAGGTLKEVADVLRHRELNTTMIYAKIDVGRLAAVAMPWRGSAA